MDSIVRLIFVSFLATSSHGLHSFYITFSVWFTVCTYHCNFTHFNLNTFLGFISLQYDLQNTKSLTETLEDSFGFSSCHQLPSTVIQASVFHGYLSWFCIYFVPSDWSITFLPRSKLWNYFSQHGSIAPIQILKLVGLLVLLAQKYCLPILSSVCQSMHIFYFLCFTS